MTEEQKNRINKFREEQARQLKRACTSPICAECIFLSMDPKPWSCRINDPSTWKV